MNEAFNKWWDLDLLTEDNPFVNETPAYWAWEGWKAAKQPAQQELVAWASDVLFDNDTEIIPANDKGKLGTGGLTIALYAKGETA